MGFVGQDAPQFRETAERFPGSFYYAGEEIRSVFSFASLTGI